MKDNKKTRECVTCNNTLNEDKFQPSAFNAPPSYNVKCKPCMTITRRANAQAVARKKSAGYVYIVTNKAWPDWCKVGVSINPEQRIKGYNTGSPLRDYEMPYTIKVEDQFDVERKTIDILSKRFEVNSEWIKTSPEQAISAINKSI